MRLSETCDGFKLVAGKFMWFSVKTNGKLLYVMPSIMIDAAYIRVNNCPVCGKEVRDLQITEEEFKELLAKKYYHD